MPFSFPTTLSQTVFLPGETPAMAMTYPYSALDRELKRMKTAHNYTAEELETKVVYKRGRGPSRYMCTCCLTCCCKYTCIYSY